MIVTRGEKVEEKAKGVKLIWLIDERWGKNYVMRKFIMEPGSEIPKHKHPWEHEIFVVDGKGIIGDEKSGEIEVKEGDALYIEPSVMHWYKNHGESDFVFICVIPSRKVFKQ